MTSAIFFSWQLDTPTRTGRNFLERTLERAIGILAADVTLEGAARDLKVDRDTKGVSGSPSIVDTIFKKIDAAEAFVADVTFVGKRLNGRPTPNPNVMSEYGWALKSRTQSRVIAVMNTAYGEPAGGALPFNMQHLRFPIQYHLPEDASTDQVSQEKDRLAKVLADALRAIVHIPKTPPVAPAIFSPRPAGASPGRFRTESEPLGHADESFFGGSAYPVWLKLGPVSWLRLMPETDPARRWTWSELKAAATTTASFLHPYGAGNAAYSLGYLRDADGGFGVRAMLAESKDQALWASFVFKTGEIWGIDAYTMGAAEDQIILDRYQIGQTLDNYRTILKRLGLDGPYKWSAGFEGIRGRGVVILGSYADHKRGTALADIIRAEGELLDDQNVNDAVRSFVAAVCDQCGVPPPAR